MHWTERQRAVARISKELQRRGWTLYGYTEDKSDPMTDYYAPASWRGVATHPDYPGVVVCVDVMSASESGKDETGTKAIPDEVCPRCNGDKLDPLGWTLGAARADPERYHKETKEAKFGPDSGVVSLSNVISPIPFDGMTDNARLKCVKCEGRGHTVKIEEYVRWTWPEFHATPKGKTWHVERDGEIVKTGTGLQRCARWGEEGQAATKALVDKIEAIFTGDTPPWHCPPGQVGHTQVAATGEGYTIEYDRDWTWVRFTSKPSEAVREALREQLGARWGRRRKAWYIREHVEAETIIAVISSVLRAEPTRLTCPPGTAPR